MAKFEEVWEHGRLVIRRADLRGGEGRRGSAVGRSVARNDAGLVAKALKSLRAAAPVRSAPHVDQAVRMDGRAMEKALRELAGQKDGLRRAKRR
jgi:hypothetical protein